MATSRSASPSRLLAAGRAMVASSCWLGRPEAGGAALGAVRGANVKFQPHADGKLCGAGIGRQGGVGLEVYACSRPAKWERVDLRPDDDEVRFYCADCKRAA